MTVTTKVVLSAISTILFIIATCLLAATIALGWLYGTQRSPEGFITDSDVSMSTGGYAITSTELDLGSVPAELFPANLVGTFQVQVESASGSPVFVGVGPSDEVGDYLADVELAEVTRFGSRQLSYTEHSGSASPQPPAQLGFWTVSSEGNGRQTLDWEPESGMWTLVVMNSDAAAGLEVAASVGFDSPWLLIGMLLTGVLTVFSGAAALVIGVLASKRSTEVEPRETASPEPATLSR